MTVAARTSPASDIAPFGPPEAPRAMPTQVLERDRSRAPLAPLWRLVAGWRRASTE